MELLLAQPIRAASVVLAHLGVDVVVIPLLCLSLWAGTALGCGWSGRSRRDTAALKEFPFPVQVDEALLQVDPWAFGPALWNVGGLMFAVSGVTMALSAAGRFRNRVIGVAVLVFLLQFLVNVVGQMWDAVELAAAVHGLLLLPAAADRPRRWTVNPGVWARPARTAGPRPAAWGGGPIRRVNVAGRVVLVHSLGRRTSELCRCGL